MLLPCLFVPALKCFARRNLAINGAAIMNGGGYVKFSSADIINMVDNVATESVRLKSEEYRTLHNMKKTTSRQSKVFFPID